MPLSTCAVHFQALWSLGWRGVCCEVWFWGTVAPANTNTSVVAFGIQARLVLTANTHSRKDLGNPYLNPYLNPFPHYLKEFYCYPSTALAGF